MEHSRYLKTAQFAALCGVKKDTLLHYDHIGLLKPARTGENGYRYYTVRQLATYDMIAALQRLGTPLAEIRAYLARRSPQELLTLLEEKERAIRAERIRLEQAAAVLADSLRTTRLAVSVTPGEIRMEELPALWYIAVPAPRFTRFEEDAFLLRIRGLLAQARETGTAAASPGDIIHLESMEQGRFLEDAYYIRTAPDTPEALYRPPCRADVLYHRGSFDSQAEACRRLWNRVHSEGLVPAGDLFEEDLIGTAAAPSPQDCLMRLCLPVEIHSPAS